METIDMLVDTSLTEDDLNRVRDECYEHHGWSGMTYEQGVRAAIDWIVGDGPDPFDDE